MLSNGYATKNWRRNTTSGIEHLVDGPNSEVVVCGLVADKTIIPMVPIHLSEVTRPCRNCMWSLETSHLMRVGALGVVPR